MQLFNFVHPGLLSFNLQAVLDHNSFEMRTQMVFGPGFSSEQKKISGHCQPVRGGAPCPPVAVCEHPNSRPEVLPARLKPGTTVGIDNRFSVST